MRIAKLVLICSAVCAAVVLPVLAQEGHPLKGSWIGDWGPNAAMRTPIFLVLDWDGKSVTGTLNPGTDSLALKNVAITLPARPELWTVRMETTTKDGQPIVIEGRVENLGLSNRTFAGEWTQGAVKGTFKLGRQ